jgi:acetyl esterase/lipase
VTKGSSAVQAAVAFYPPTDFLQMDEQMLPGACTSFNATFGLTDCHNDPASPESSLVGYPIQTRPRAVRATDPSRCVSRADPPITILHGQEDQLVPHAQSILLYNALRARGNEATCYSVPGAGHDWRQVLDPANHTRHIVYRASGGAERITVGARTRAGTPSTRSCAGRCTDPVWRSPPPRGAPHPLTRRPVALYIRAYRGHGGDLTAAATLKLIRS